MKRVLLLAVIALAMLLSACGAAETTPEPTATSLPTTEPVAVPSSEPLPEATPEPSPETLPPQSGAAVAHDGDAVWVHYRGTLADDTVFDSSLDGDPLEFTIGAGSMIAGFEDAVRGMRVGERKTVTIPAAEAYGPYRYDQVFVVGRDQLQPGLEPEVGQRLQMITPGGGVSTVLVVEVAETTVTIDANHLLAGEDLTFEIMLIGIQ